MKVNAIAILLIACLLVGCDCFKGDKGSPGRDGTDGSSGVTDFKTVFGTPDNNPHTVVVPAITGGNNQLVNVYMVRLAEKYRLNYTTDNVVHQYCLNGSNVVISSVKKDGSVPATALNDTPWGQCSYRIEVYTFSSAQAAQAYRSKSQSNDLNSLIYGR